MKDSFPKFEDSKLSREQWLDCYCLKLESDLSAARAAARILKPERYDAMVGAAKGCGYALAVHGSCARDVDLIAVPWVETAESAKTVAEAIADAAEGFIKDIEKVNFSINKPHRRIAVVILCAGGYIDLAIMQREAV